MFGAYCPSDVFLMRSNGCAGEYVRVYIYINMQMYYCNKKAQMHMKKNLCFLPGFILSLWINACHFEDHFCPVLFSTVMHSSARHLP